MRRLCPHHRVEKISCNAVPLFIALDLPAKFQHDKERSADLSLCVGTCCAAFLFRVLPCRNMGQRYAHYLIFFIPFVTIHSTNYRFQCYEAGQTSESWRDRMGSDPCCVAVEGILRVVFLFRLLHVIQYITMNLNSFYTRSGVAWVVRTLQAATYTCNKPDVLQFARVTMCWAVNKMIGFQIFFSRLPISPL